MNAIKKNVSIQFLTVIFTVLILSIFWEFYLEESIFFGSTISDNIESAGEKWEYIFTSLVFAFIALLYPMLKLNQSLIKIEETNENLESLIKQRTKDLEKKNEELIVSNRAKTEFLSRMNHEFRTPMNAILGFTQLLQIDSKQSLSENQLENLEMIYSSGKDLLELINNILDLSQVESGNIILAKEIVNINLVLEKVISMYQPLTVNKNISITFHEENQQGYSFECDSLRLTQVCSILLSNAIRYNKMNGTVEIITEDRGEGIIRIGFLDSGRGIAQENIGKIFQPFDRFDVDPENTSGVGVSLSISKQLIELMNGKIGVESSVGEGSYFFIDMPLAK